MIGGMNSFDSQPFEHCFVRAWPAENWRDITVIAAVSGGPDSVALIRGLAKLKAAARGAGRLIVAHFNHRLRAESDADAEFVAQLAEQLSLPCEIGDKKNVASAKLNLGDGIEAAARAARYEFLQSTAERYGARFVATGHTADDQIETVLFNILRGTGLSGLAGIPRARLLGDAVSLIRPMLGIRRAEILQYLNSLGQTFRTDATNASSDFTRNRIRNKLLPLLRADFNSDVDGALARLSDLACDAQRLIERLAEELLDGCLSPEFTPTMPPAMPGTTECKLSTSPLASTDRHLVREVFVALWRRLDWPLQQMGFSQWETLAEMAQADIGRNDVAPLKRTLPGNVLIERIGNKLVLSTVTPRQAPANRQ
jgi:tRNA(Ile)-lysidine synthase